MPAQQRDGAMARRSCGMIRAESRRSVSEYVDSGKVAPYNDSDQVRRTMPMGTGRTRKELNRFMVLVELRDGESLDAAIRRLKRQVQQTGILEEARRHERYEKPSERRRRVAAASVRRQRTQASKD